MRERSRSSKEINISDADKVKIQKEAIRDTAKRHRGSFKLPSDKK